jgi:Putative prokaryotic signal transducing protein
MAWTMQTVYEAANAAEAHMIADLLRQEGVVAHVRGEHLQGALGELPAAGLVRLEVHPQDHDRARDFIARWEAAQPQEPHAAPVPAAASPRWLGGLLLGVLAGAVVATAFFRTPTSTDGIDHNGDGVLDERWTLSPAGTLLKSEADRNLDGQIDFISHFDRRGQVATTEADDDFNGSFETHLAFVRGNLDRAEVDTDGDGFPDLHASYANGVVQANAFIDRATGLPLRVEHYRLGKLTHAEVDADRDGTLDTAVSYTPLGEVASRRALPATR